MILYIGSSKNVERRIQQHFSALRNQSHINRYLQHSFNLHGEAYFSWDLMEELTDIDDLFIREEFFIKEYSDRLYNLGTIGGGDNLTNHPDRNDIIERIRTSMLTRYKNLSEIKHKELIERMQGSSNPNYGNSWSDAQKKSASDRTSNRYIEHPHILANISETLSNKWNTMTDEEKVLISPNIKKISIDGVVYMGMNDAAKKTGLNAYTIRYRAKSINFPNYKYII